MEDPTPDSEALARAIELAEQIVCEVARPQQDWGALRNMAIELARLADQLARDTPGSQDPTGQRPAPESRDR